MDNLGNSLRFKREECDPLCTVLASYRRARPNTLTQAEEARLAAAHHIATVVMLTDMFGEGAVEVAYRATSVAHPVIETPGPEDQEIIVDNEQDTVGTAIRWAAEELVPGSATIGGLIVSEDLLVTGGVAAGVWAAQLPGGA